MSHNCCNGFTRSQALRRAAGGAAGAVAPRDPRAPAPAGRGLDRKQFLLRSAGVVIGFVRLRSASNCAPRSSR